ncbi:MULTISPECIES: hypothetical protein [Bradyrhizobium]|uniref:hypothetical protein n=1 Tax=Bradyrhizobium TaxID=374 RepID=UPI001BA61321|nr:hypothetical protein [Bradyrhizobium liaoningense]MBR0986742.1 hypothetical protein [Bradyrhizobium liaoningense]GMO13113.1 hypothetical protein TM233_13060 [Bradyrhizobium sp. TM233]GMO98649.1 hypothetical protein TM239_19030 [Bradyrhizobium sp. TM239]
MTWKNFISRRVIASRRRGLATATLYGLSLAVRFTSATGEEVEIPAQAMHPTYPLVSIMIRDGSGLPYQDWGPRTTQPVVFRQSWLRQSWLHQGWPSSSPLSRCVAP